MLCSRMNVRFGHIVEKVDFRKQSVSWRRTGVFARKLCGDLVIGSLFNERPRVIANRRTFSIYVSRKFLTASVLSFST
jgi:hypothetical protein